MVQGQPLPPSFAILESEGTTPITSPPPLLATLCRPLNFGVFLETVRGGSGKFWWRIVTRIHVRKVHASNKSTIQKS